MEGAGIHFSCWGESVDESLATTMAPTLSSTSRMLIKKIGRLFFVNTPTFALAARFFCLCGATAALALPAQAQDSAETVKGILRAELLAPRQGHGGQPFVFLGPNEGQPAARGFVPTGLVKLVRQDAENELEEGPESRFVEPIMTEETMPNPVGDWDFRISTEYRRRGNETTAAIPRIQFFGGLFPRVGIEIGVPLAYHDVSNETKRGIGDVEITLKRLMTGDGSATTAVVLGLETGLPTGSVADDLSEGAYELAPFVALLRDFGPCSIQGNTGWSTQVAARDGENESQWFYNVALITPGSESQLHFIGELNGGWSDSPDSSPLSAAFGIKYPVGDGGFLALGIPFGLNSDADDWGVVVQFQMEF